MIARHDSQNTLFRSPYGARRCGESVLLRVLCPDCVPTLRTWTGEETLYPMTKTPDGLWQAELVLPPKPGLVWYYFIIKGADSTMYLGNRPDNLGGDGMLWEQEPPSFQITVFARDFATPEWMQDGVLYQIFPDRFFDGRNGKLLSRRNDIQIHADWTDMPLYTPEGRSQDNAATDFFGGNLEGIRKKLPYLQRLGVTVLYLNPIFAAHSNHRYDTADYERVDPLLGDEEDLKKLCSDAGKAGIRILLDGVFSHCGEDSRYFDRYGKFGHGAYSDPESPYRDWFKFEQYPDRYVCWWGVPTLPEIREDTPSYREFITGQNGVVRRWLRCGVSGWRLDVADELPDSFIEELRNAVKAEKTDAALLGEVWEDASNKISYDCLRTYALGCGLDSVMNYPLREALLGFFLGTVSAEDAARRIESLRENYPEPFFRSLMNLIGSHDRARVLTLLGGVQPDSIPKEEWPAFRLSPESRSLAEKRLLALWALVCALPGMPALYYGDETGMEGMPDPYCRAGFPWGEENSPLSEGIRRSIQRRRQSGVWTRGSLRVFAPEENVLAAERCLGEEKRIFFCNRSEKYAASVSVPSNGGILNINIAPLGFSVLRKSAGNWEEITK